MVNDNASGPTSGPSSPPPPADARQGAQFVVLRSRWLTAAGNVVAAPVGNGATSLAVVFPRSEPDVNYGVLCTPSWDTTVFVTSKAVGGCDVNFGTAAGASDTIDVATFRAGR